MHWIGVTNDEKRRIFINLSTASAIIPSKDGTDVFFAGSPEDSVHVTESFEEIMAKEPYVPGEIV